MAFWSRVLDTVRSLAKRGKVAPDALQKLRSANRQVAFTIALISLGAKLAKVDGRVTLDEIRAFKSVFRCRPEDEAKVAKVYNLAMRTVAGYEQYAASVSKLYAHDESVRDDVMEGLFHIATADGHIQADEEEFLRRVNGIFGLPERNFSQRLHRFTAGSSGNPYTVLDVDPSASDDAVRERWKQLVRQSHPDALIARGAPPEAAKLAQARLADYNRSWDEIRTLRGI